MTTPPLDADVLAKLEELMGEDFPLLVETYLKDSEHRLGQLMSATDPRVVREAAHSFKGSSSNMGALSLARLCGDLEKQPLEAPAATIALLQAQIATLYADVRAAFLAMRREP
ncbi:Hpt domain-containing protein [Pseudomonas sp. DC3000-4b1]|uniref:Hpt domain-containing protein n=1 Tax=unclassified Pseudomonas TaxID=196821 RepID=UPI003CE86262